MASVSRGSSSSSSSTSSSGSKHGTKKHPDHPEASDLPFGLRVLPAVKELES